MATVATIVPLLTALALNTHLEPAESVQSGHQVPYRCTTLASSKICGRTKMRLFKQAAKAKFHSGVGKKMTSRVAGGEVIEISDDDSDDELPSPQRLRAPTAALRRSENRSIEGMDEGELPYRRPPPTRLRPSHRSQPSIVEGDDEAELEDTSPDSNLSDSDSQTPPRRPTVLHQRQRNDRTAANFSTTSVTTADDSDCVQNSPRGKTPSRRTPAVASVLSTTVNPGDVLILPTAPNLASARAPTGQLANAAPNGSRARCEAAPCPYYYDHALRLKMYKGQGYENFPVVLGTVEGHKELCDKWDAQAASKTTVPETHPLETRIPPALTRTSADEFWEDACLRAVLQVFPEIEHEFVRDLYRKAYAGAVAEDLVGTVSAALIADIAESETYPRQKMLKRKASPVATDETGVTVVWNKDLPKDHGYRTEAIILLANVFDHIPTHYIAKIVQEQHALFDAFGVLSEKETHFCNSDAGERPYKRLRHPRRTLELKYQRKGVEPRDGHQYMNLVNELQAARQNQAREASGIKRQKASDELESENLALHMAQGSMVECQCCFDDRPINRAVPCEGEAVHFFCNDCVQRQAESQIGAMKYEMRCMDTSGCKADLSTEGIAQAISLQLFDKLAFNQQQAEISSAGIQGLEMCPFCDFKAICEPVERDSIFDCQNPDCGLVTCRKCKERSHLPKTCEEVKNDKGLGARHKVEEARSEAMMRTCPKCKVKLIKEYGCNKMVCTNCYAVMCYVCQKDISGTGKEQGYEHFHRAGATCALHDQTGVDRHETEANAAELAAIERAKVEYDDIDEKTLRIETGGSQKGSKVTKAPAVLPAPPLRAIPYPAFLPGAHMPPLPAMPQFPAPPPRDAVPLVVPMPREGPPHFQQAPPPGRAPLPGHMQPDLNPLPPLGQPLYGQLNGPAGPALPFNHGTHQRQALQAFLRQRHHNPI